MNKYMGFVVVLLIYFGAAQIGLSLFGEGAYAAYLCGIVGTLAFLWVIKNEKNDK